MDVETRKQEASLMAELMRRQDDQVTDDQLVWRWTKEGVFTVKSFYTAMNDTPCIKNEFNKLWEVKAPMRVRIFTWLMLRNRILTQDNLIRRGWQIANICYLCRQNQESVKCMFGTCKYTAGVYREMRRHMNFTWTQKEYASGIIKSVHMETRQILVTVCFVVWRERCRRIFRQECKTPRILMNEIEQEIGSWFRGD
jgi:hypothetical protein